MDPKSVYKSLKTEINSNPSGYSLTLTICNNIKKLPLDHSMFIQGLINEHFVINSRKKKIVISDLAVHSSKKNNTLTVAYKGKTHENGKGPEFTVSKLPIELQKILVAYYNRIVDLS